MICDGINEVHDNIEINKTDDGVRFICKQCKHVFCFRIDANGRMNTRQYGRVFKRDTAQPGSNIYYKIYKDKMSII